AARTLVSAAPRLISALFAAGDDARGKNLIFQSQSYANFVLFAASSQRTFFWLLSEMVAMCPEMAACWPTGGGAMGFSLPSTDWIKFLKWLMAPSLSLKSDLPLRCTFWRDLMFSGAL